MTADTKRLLEKWRHLIEPETSGGLTPVAWNDVLKMNLMVYELGESVLVMRDCTVFSKRMRSIWVAAGVLNEVRSLVVQAESNAKQDGIKFMIYMGRRGWLRACGYDEVAAIGQKEL